MSRYFITLIALSLVVGCAEQGGVSTTGKGVLTGGALGAGLGAIIGHQTGNTGAGIAIGSAAGLLGGGLVGNQVEQGDRKFEERGRAIENQEKILEENRRLIEQLRNRGADVRTTDRGIVVNLPDVLFEFDSARLTNDARRTARDISEVVAGVPSRSIYVEGHTDSVGTLTYNQKLSEDRAWSVADALAKDGVRRDRLFVKGFGENDPIASNSTEAGRKRNRRVEVIIGNR